MAPARRTLAVLAALAAAAAAAAAGLALLLGGDSDDRRRAAVQAAPTVAVAGLEIGLAEQSPHLVAPGAVPAAFAPWRDRAAALRPRWFRLMVDWSKVQPDGGAPPDWTRAADGCLRGIAPCASHGGVRALLRALRERRAADGGWEVIASVYGAPDWALEPADGCPAGGTIRLGPYRALLRSLDAVAWREGVAIRWWSPWNEPNHPAFHAPQREACGGTAAAVSPAAYARLVRAAGEALPADARLVLGEAAGYTESREDAVAAAELAAALPRDVVCAGDVWAQHAYVGRGRTALAAERDRGGHAALLQAVTRALDAHGCPRRHRVWITETGSATDGRDDACAAMDDALRAWHAHPRVDVAIQYTFREDPAFRVGLADTALTTELPAYRAWRAWGGTRDPAASPPDAPCGAAR